MFVLPKLKLGTQIAQAPPSGNGEGWGPSDGNTKCLSQALTPKCPLGKVYAFHQPHKKCLKAVTVKLPKHPPPPKSPRLCMKFLTCIFTKQMETGGSISEAQQCQDHYCLPIHILLISLFFLLIKVKLFLLSNRRKREKSNESKSSPHTFFQQSKAIFFN